MPLQQISVFMENKTGRLAEVTDVLGRENINLRAISIADTADFGICRLIVNEPKKTLEILEKNGFTAKETDVLGVEVEDRPNGLAEILKTFHQNGVNIEYLYATLERKQDKAVVIFKVEDITLGSRIIQEHGLVEVTTI